MINISKLYCGQVTDGDWLRYGVKDNKGRIVPSKASQRRPVVVWNITKACNLKCVHCYSSSTLERAENELNTQQAKTVLDNLAEFGVPAVLFSGGEPLMRPDLFVLLDYAEEIGLRTVISTNGTLITAKTADKIKRANVSYVGISLDGIGATNDKFRATAGAFERAVQGIRNCQDREIKVGVRLTLTKRNVQDLEGFFEFFETENIQRACFYHLVPTGRASEIADQALSHSQSKKAIDTILAKTKTLQQTGRKTDILTVDNHVDGVYLYLKLLDEDEKRADRVRRLLEWNGGGMFSSGVGIGCIDFNGYVHPDQFWRHYNLGNVHDRSFSEIWSDPDEPLLNGLRNRRQHIKGRCKQCRFFDICGGSLRVRADLSVGDPWAPDPACYLSDEQIGLYP